MENENPNQEFDEELTEIQVDIQTVKNVGFSQPSLPSWLIPITNAMIEAILDFIGGFRDDFIGRDSWRVKCIRVAIRTAISVFLSITLISASLFLIAQIKSQWMNISESVTECSSSPSQGSSAGESFQSVECSPEIETDTVDAENENEHTESLSINSIDEKITDSD